MDHQRPIIELTEVVALHGMAAAPSYNSEMSLMWCLAVSRGNSIIGM